MRLLILSDIHANLEALEASIAAFPAYDAVWNLGDVVGYGANPNEVIERSRELGTVFVRGNHDKACSGISDLSGFNPVAALAAYWTKKNLSGEHLAWLKALPKGPVEPIPELSLACVHGSPIDEDEYLLDAHDAAESLRRPAAPCTFFGHTHVQGGFFTRNGEVHTLRPAYEDKSSQQRIEFALEPESTYLINPGSIGQPRDGDPRSGFLLYDTEHRHVTFFRIPYDVQGAQQRILNAGLPARLADRLADGR